MLTITFNEVFPDFNEWEQMTNELGFIEEDKLFNLYYFNVLARRYGKQGIRYSTKDDFITELSLVVQTNFYYFKRTKEVIDSMYKLDDEELSLIQQSINNIAKGPNQTIVDPLKPVEFLSEQNFLNVNGNRLRAYTDTLNLLVKSEIPKILNDAKKLFTVVLIDYDYFFEEGEKI